MPDLRQLRQRGPLKRPDEVLEQLLTALAARHDGGSVHGALCPEAVHIAADGSLSLQSAEPDADFRAPELEDGHAVAMTQDVYAAGAIAWFALTGVAPGRPPRPLHGYGWLDEVVTELTAPVGQRPLNGGQALQRFQAHRPRTRNRAPYVLAAALALAGLALFVTSPDPTPPPEPAPAPAPPDPPPVVCKDANAQGPHLEAAQAWQTCRFATAHRLYQDNPDAAPAVLACRTERTEAAGPHLAELQAVEGDLDRGACHWARLKLEDLPLDPGPGCQTTLELCEEQELPLRQAQVALSEGKLKLQLASPLVTDVVFRPLADPWIWDIVVHGGWTAFFAQLRGSLDSEDPQAAATASGMLGYFTAVCAAVGHESANTLWTSRDLVFEDATCVNRLPTADARTVARRLEDAVASGDADALVAAVQYVFSRLRDC